jgi:putative ABC transport system permease protein
LRLPPAGLVLSLKLAEVLDAQVGDEIFVEVLDGRRRTQLVPVSGIVEEYMGTSAYMEIDALRGLAGEGDTLTGAFLKVDPSMTDALYARLKDIPAVAGVGLKRTSINSFNKTLGDTFYVMIFFNLLFSGVIAGGVVYNAARVSFSERSRELASLRVLGFTRGEISFILLGELGVVTIIAIPIGLLA